MSVMLPLTDTDGSTMSVKCTAPGRRRTQVADDGTARDRALAGWAGLRDGGRAVPPTSLRATTRTTVGVANFGDEQIKMG